MAKTVCVHHLLQRDPNLAVISRRPLPVENEPGSLLFGNIILMVAFGVRPVRRFPNHVVKAAGG